MASYKWTFWIDTGGTFTDCLAFDPEGTLQRLKVLSSGVLRGKIIRKRSPHTYEIKQNWQIRKDIFKNYQLCLFGSNEGTYLLKSIDFEKGTLQLDTDLHEDLVLDKEFEISSGEEAPVLCLRLATQTSLDDHLPQVEIRLGSTKGTNALLERKGANVGLVVTKGFADVIEIGSQQRPDIFSLDVKKRKQLYTQAFEVNGRINSKGIVTEQPLSNNIDDLCNRICDAQIEAVAVALLNSYQNNVHEKEIEVALKKAGIRHVSLSSAMANEIKILPRTNTAIINAYLSPIIREYANAVIDKVPNGSLKIMTSAGGLVDAALFQPKDSLLSGPAGGVVGAASIARSVKVEKILTFDMGGTSTDVSRYDGNFDYVFESKIDGIPVFSPSMNIETVAAGGGSICDFDGHRLIVGPESAGAAPGPACYGAKGPMTITDVNLLLGRIDPDNFGIPLDKSSANAELEALRLRIKAFIPKEKILEGFLQIANEKMAEAIRRISLSKGYDPTEYALFGFGGAGGQHTCAVADLLNLNKIIVPFDAGLLSAFGMGVAEIERFASKQLLKPLKQSIPFLPELFEQLTEEAIQELLNEGVHRESIYIRRKDAYMRFKGQESTLKVAFRNPENLIDAFQNRYESLYGHWLTEGIIEIESIRLVAAAHADLSQVDLAHQGAYPSPPKTTTSYIQGSWQEIPAYIWEELKAGDQYVGPAILMSQNSTLFIDYGWKLSLDKNLNAILNKTTETHKPRKTNNTSFSSAGLELFSNRFKSVADEMGAVLQRTSFSVNVKERLDFSCAVLDARGYLVANAPHIPVHLGGLGICVRSVIEKLPLKPGDVIITNHPGYGGSHLPDITLISPVYNAKEIHVGYVANRAHHAEMGGISPGSVPANAKNLSEEGVVIFPTYLAQDGIVKWEEIQHILSSSIYPSRSVNENMADLNGALASIRTGVSGLRALCDKHGTHQVQAFMESLQQYSDQTLIDLFKNRTDRVYEATQFLDDRHKINVLITITEEEVNIDFADSSGIHHGNLNATYAILNSAVIYVLKLMISGVAPLNEGIMRHVHLTAPSGFLNPIFNTKPANCPAVVGGNTETSQRIVDTLIRAFGLAACSQGTMNNLIFGNDHFGFYETIGGGVGAGDGFHGADAVHQHMTNTKITDPEIMEFRYPVRVEKMTIRKRSGGKGQWNGGNGIVRVLTFLEPVDLNILSQHRKEVPYGMKGGQPGKPGEQYVIRASGRREILKGVDETRMNPGDSLIIETPGGGGWGKDINNIQDI